MSGTNQKNGEMPVVQLKPGDKLRFLHAHGDIPAGAEVEVVQADEQGRPIQLRVGDKHITLANSGVVLVAVVGYSEPLAALERELLAKLGERTEIRRIDRETIEFLNGKVAMIEDQRLKEYEEFHRRDVAAKALEVSLRKELVAKDRELALRPPAAPKRVRLDVIMQADGKLVIKYPENGLLSVAVLLQNRHRDEWAHPEVVRWYDPDNCLPLTLEVDA